MTTIGMILLALFTVFGGMILGWLARWWLLDGHLDKAEADRRSEERGQAGAKGPGAIGTVAVGTAAVGFVPGAKHADDDPSDVETSNLSEQRESDAASRTASLSSSEQAAHGEMTSGAVDPKLRGTVSPGFATGASAKAGTRGEPDASGSQLLDRNSTAGVSSALGTSIDSETDAARRAGADNQSDLTSAASIDGDSDDSTSSAAKFAGVETSAEATAFKDSLGEPEIEIDERSLDHGSSASGSSSTTDSASSAAKSGEGVSANADGLDTGSSLDSNDLGVEQATSEPAISEDEVWLNATTQADADDVASAKRAALAAKTDGQSEGSASTAQTLASGGHAGPGSDVGANTANTDAASHLASTSTDVNAVAGDARDTSTHGNAGGGDASNDGSTFSSKAALSSSGSAAGAEAKHSGDERKFGVGSADAENTSRATEASSDTNLVGKPVATDEAAAATRGLAGREDDASDDQANATSKAALAGAGAATAAVSVASSGIAATDAEKAKHAELEETLAEARQLRARLGLSSDGVGIAGDGSAALDARLNAAREDTRALRAQLWEQENSDAQTANADSKLATTGTSSASGLGDFGTLSDDEAEAQTLIAAGTIPTAPTNSLEAPTPGFDPDNLTKINGIGKPTEARLNRSGIYYYDQIASFSASDLAWADGTFKLEGRAVTDRWIPQARFLSANNGKSGASAATKSTSIAARPASLLDKPIEGRAPDDLTAIKGIGPKLQEQLNDKGIYYYSQIAEFTDADQAWANETLGFPGRVERDDWIPQARELLDSSASASDADGRGARLNVLANAGRQLDSLSTSDEPGEMSNDETEAMRLIESGEFVATDANKPTSLLPSASAGAKDDLKEIKGVGPKLEDLLNGLGIYYFRQVASFGASDIAWVDSKLRFRGRIVRDRWVDQAKRLS